MSNKNRTCPLNIYGTELLLQIYCDTISVEIFINGGDCSMSNLIYPEKSDPVIMLQAANGVLHVAEMTVWPLENIW